MPIQLIDYSADKSVRIDRFSSSGASSVELAHGSGESHAYAVHFIPGGEIGPHPAGFDQLFVVLQGSGWVAGTDGVRHAVGLGCGAFIPTGEVHSKGSDTGMVAIMVQSTAFELAVSQVTAEQASEADREGSIHADQTRGT